MTISCISIGNFVGHCRIDNHRCHHNLSVLISSETPRKITPYTVDYTYNKPGFTMNFGIK